jgi:hypothetical protein
MQERSLTLPARAQRIRAALGENAAALAAPLLLVFLVCLPLVLFGPYVGHSFAYDINWARGFDSALLDGAIYPRWLTALNGGAGSPVFFFYGPIPFYFHFVGSLVAPGSDAPVELGVAITLIVLSSTVAFFAFARDFADTKAAALGALTYSLLPYHLAVDGWVRLAIGELAAYIWMPLVLRAVDRIANGRAGFAGVAGFYALLAATHLPSTVLFSGFLLIYAAFRAGERRQGKVFLWTLLGMGCGALLAGIYVAPAMLLQYTISTNELWTTTFFDYTRWFFFGRSSPDPTYSKRLLALVAITTLAFAALFVLAYRRVVASERRSLWVWVAIVGVAWFLMTPLSMPLWKLLPTLQKVQFPWRATIIVDVAFAVCAVFATRKFGPKDRAGWAALSVIGLVLALSLAATARSAKTSWDKSRDPSAKREIEALLARGIDAPEYIPSGVILPSQEERGPRIWDRAKAMRELELDEAVGTVSVDRWASRHLAFTLELERPTAATVRQFHFPGWTARTSGTSEAVVIGREPSAGLMRLTLPKGRYRLELVLERLPEERTGAALTALGALATLLLAWWERRALRTTAAPN